MLQQKKRLCYYGEEHQSEDVEQNAEHDGVEQKRNESPDEGRFSEDKVAEVVVVVQDILELLGLQNREETLSPILLFQRRRRLRQRKVLLGPEVHSHNLSFLVSCGIRPV